VSCSLVYDAQLSRVRVDADTLCVSGTAAYATVERSPDASSYTLVRGGTDVVVVTGCGFGVPVDDYEFPVNRELTYRVSAYDEDGDLTARYTCEITVDQDDVWLKSVERPFLNLPLDCVLNPTPVRRRARQGVFQIMGRSVPVATTDVRGGVEVTLTTVTGTYAEQVALDYLVAAGDVLYLQTPTTFPLTSMFAVWTDNAEFERPLLNRSCDRDPRRVSLSLVQVQPPDPDVVGTTSTWLTVTLTYATWADVVAAHTDWADLLELVANPSEVIVT
jgi:hypothetical protein